ncbi:helix-turn-helix domain-containing protein [uncultured Microbacterium sp.]|uniref:helix-turn-helix domain-containing protein n=1 Tax=uncultured Microbacterium sp. TaxID=191216 RepID=UPI0025D5D9FA|nr:helix-turn-helix domain-containing protein [uncultured Microbacterium sp.]
MSTNAAPTATTTPDDRIAVATAVRAHYSAAGLSASALAREIGMSQSKMSRRTTFAEPFDIDELSAIASVLDISIVDLISGTNLPSRPRFGRGGMRSLYLVETPDLRTLVPKVAGSTPVGGTLIQFQPRERASVARSGLAPVIPLAVAR